MTELTNIRSISDGQPPASAIIVSQDRLQSDLLKSCLKNALPITCQCYIELPLLNVIEEPSSRRIIYLLDCLRLNMDAIEAILHVGMTRIPDHVLIALYNIRNESLLSPLVKRYKIRGIFFREDAQEAFIQGIQAMLSGRLWLTRKMLSNCVRETDRSTGDRSHPALTCFPAVKKKF